MTSTGNKRRSENIRAFIAYMLPPELSVAIHREVSQSDLLRKDKDISWVAPQNYHLTLRFLGQCTENQLSAIGDQLAQELADFPRFICKSGALDFFPHHRPRVMVLKTVAYRRMGKLYRLYRECEEIAVANGCIADRHSFRPHITLARCRNLEPKPDIMQNHKWLLAHQLQINHIALVASDLLPEGVRYRVLRIIQLSKE